MQRLIRMLTGGGTSSTSTGSTNLDAASESLLTETKRTEGQQNPHQSSMATGDGRAFAAGDQNGNYVRVDADELGEARLASMPSTTAVNPLELPAIATLTTEINDITSIDAASMARKQALESLKEAAVLHVVRQVRIIVGRGQGMPNAATLGLTAQDFITQEKQKRNLM